MVEEQSSEVQVNTDTPAENGSTESATTIENDSANTNTNEEAKNTPEIKSESVEANKPNTEEKPSGAPEQYGDFTVPEGFSAPIDDFKSWAKENNMSQEKAQSAIDFYTKTIVPQQQAAQVAQNEAWVKESTEKYGKQGIEAANKALGRFSTPEFTKFLADTGLGNHPEMIGIFNTINARISESSFVDAKTKQASKVLFPNSPDMYK
jgi:hypothetical protein